MAWIRTQRYALQVPCWQQAGRVRLALLSDLHNNIYPGLLNTLQEEKPDLVIIAGDMINRPTSITPPRFTRGYGCVSRIAQAFPVLYALGNHESTWRGSEAYREGFRQYQRALEKKGVRFLINDSLEWGEGEHPLRFSGVELDHLQYTHHLKKRRPPEQEALAEKLGAPGAYQILLAHHPFYIREYAAWGADLVLAGHLHGGQMRLPFLGGVIASGFQLFPPYTKGLYQERDTQMIVSAGLGTHTIPVRPFNPRELVIIDLVSPQGPGAAPC